MKRTIKILGCIGLSLVAFAIESNASSEIATGAVSLKMTRPFVTTQEIVMATFIISNGLDNAIAFLNMKEVFLGRALILGQHTMYVDDLLGTQPGDTIRAIPGVAAITPSRRVRRAQWTLSGSGTCCANGGK